MSRKRLGEILLEEGLIDEQDLDEALRYKEQSGYRLGTALVALRIIGEWQLTEALSKVLSLPVADLASQPPSAAALRRIPARLAERFDLIPWRLEGRGKAAQLVVAMTDPLNRTVIKRMEDVAGCEVRPVLAGLSAIQRSIRQHYHGTEKGKVVAAAERLRALQQEEDPFGDPTHPGGRGGGEDSDDAGPTRHRAQGQAVERKERSPSDHAAFALEIKFRALLHVLLKKQVLSEKEYTDTLKALLNAALRRSGRG